MEDYRRTLQLIMMTSWSYREIREYVNLCGEPMGNNKAFEIKDMVTMNGGAVKYNTSRVKVDQVLSIFGKSRIEEINLLKKIIGIENESTSDDSNA